MKWTARLRRLVTAGARTPDEIRAAVYLDHGDAAAKQSRFWLLLVLATTIATAGVIADSTATVIGAMIIAPLATPIQGVAAAIAYGEPRHLLHSLGMLLGGVAVVIGLAALLAALLPELHPSADNSQITGRISPTLVDLVAAAATGLAGAFAVGRRDIGDILPGVAIAISLVPPLAVVGVIAVDGDLDAATGALLLFLTNVLAIVVVGIAVFGAMRSAAAAPAPGSSRPVYSLVAVATLLVVAALSVATYRTVRLSNWRSAATDVASRWARENDERLVLVRADGDTLVVTVEGLTDGSQDKTLLSRLGGVIPAGTPVVIDRVAGRRLELGEIPR